MNLPESQEFVKQIDNLEVLEEIEDEDAPSNALGVQVITEQVILNNQYFLRQIKLYHNNSGVIEIMTKILQYKN